MDATDKQLAYIKVLASRCGLDLGKPATEEMKSHGWPRKYGHRPADHLLRPFYWKREDATLVIDWLMDQAKGRPG